MIRSYEIDKGVRLHIDHTDKFKTNFISIYIYDLLGDNTCKLALLPSILKDGSQDFPNFMDISKKLEEMYGMNMSYYLYKKGDRQVMQILIDPINNKYVDSDVLEESFKFLSSIIEKPLLENGSFKKDYVELEKNNLKKFIESKINDKEKYAVDRLIEEMFKGERFANYEYGSIEELKEIDEKNLYEYYEFALSSLPIDIFVVGDVKDDEILQLIKKSFNFKRGLLKNTNTAYVKKMVSGVKYVVDTLDVVQGKLILGFRTDVSPEKEDYYKTILLNNILGGGPHSKLFQNVREKESLAYSIYSRVERFKGFIYISAGIDVNNYEKALNLIIEQVEKMKKGEISEEEYNASINILSNYIRSLSDSPIQRTDYNLNEIIAGTGKDLVEFERSIRSTTIDDVVRLSQNLKLDTVYFLRNHEEGR